MHIHERYYDNGGETADRYSVVFSGRGFWYARYMSENPFHPQGVGLSDGADKRSGSAREWYTRYAPFPGRPDVAEHSWGPPSIGRKGPLGRRVRFGELPPQVQRSILMDRRSLIHGDDD